MNPIDSTVSNRSIKGKHLDLTMLFEPYPINNFYNIEIEEYKLDILISEMYSLGYTENMISWILAGFSDKNFILLDPNLFNIDFDGLLYQNGHIRFNILEFRFPDSLFALDFNRVELCVPLLLLELPNFTGDIKHIKIHLDLIRIPTFPVSLRTLDLCYNRLRSIDITYLENLRELLIAENALESVRIPVVEILDISGNPLLDYSDIDFRTTYLNIGQTKKLYIGKYFYRLL